MTSGNSMKLLPLILLCAASGCVHQEPLSGNRSEALSQVRRWVPVGTPVEEACRIMRRHGFSVASNGLSRLDFEYRSSGSFWSEGMVQTCGHASAEIADGKVISVDVGTYLKGP
jgi:hypothetical protein